MAMYEKNAPDKKNDFSVERAHHLAENTGKLLFSLNSDKTEINANDQKNVRENGEQLGNPELPIFDFREQIVGTVEQSQATIITAETGAGKSTQVPQFLMEAGYKVIMTQPRVVAARTVSERIQDEVTEKLGDQTAELVGYRTARERSDSPKNRILCVTDGLQLVRELSGDSARNEKEKTVLILDEIHEWNENMEVLVAWSKKRMTEDPNFKVVAMSATMDAEKLSEFLSSDENSRKTEGGEENSAKDPAPVIEVPGRTFDIEKRIGDDSVSSEAAKLAIAGKNVLVFVPGKREIEEVIAKLEKDPNLSGTTILPLHGQLEAADQRRTFKHYDDGKIVVATNVAQTSITVDDIDAVVDSGLERRLEVKNSVEGLYLKPISRADCLQRAGRAGRVKEGEYVLAELDGIKPVPLEDREEYGVPEIRRTLLDGTTLRLAQQNIDIANMEFFHQPDGNEIAKSKARLQKLGALDENDKLTEIGKNMARMPVESHYARMLVEARKYAPEVRAQLAIALATQEAGGITFRGKDDEWRNLTSEHNSDLIADLEVFIKAQKLPNFQLRTMDINMKNLSKSREILRQLSRVEDLRGAHISLPNDEQKSELIKCILAGMVDQIYFQNNMNYNYTDSQHENERMLGNRSVVSRNVEIIAAMPFDIQSRGGRVMNILQNATKVPSIDTLREVAPQLFREKPSHEIDSERFEENGEVKYPEGYSIDESTGKLEAKFATEFDGRKLDEKWSEMPNSPAKIEELKRQVAYMTQPTRYWSELDSPDKIPNIMNVVNINSELGELSELRADQENAVKMVDVFAILDKLDLSGDETIFELDKTLENVRIEDVIPADEIAKIRENSPKFYKGMNLTYKKGVARINVKNSLFANLDSDAETNDSDSGAGGRALRFIANLPDDKLSLPDGREITVSNSFLRVIFNEQNYYLEAESGETLRDYRESARNLITKIEAKKAEIEAEKRAIQIAEESEKREVERLSENENEMQSADESEEIRENPEPEPSYTELADDKMLAWLADFVNNR